MELLGRLLPRHLQLIYEINRRFLLMVSYLHSGDTERQRRLSVIDEQDVRRVRMALSGDHRQPTRSMASRPSTPDC